jgi:RimJ/RimL family protein N-acetyltransferase
MTMSGWLREVTLEHDNVILRPMTEDDADAIVEAASDGELWKLWYTTVPSANTIESYLASALADKAGGTAMPFVVISKNENRIIGSSRFCNALVKHRRVEVGYTFYAKRWQRTAVNTQCKTLLLQHAFEDLDAIAVEFRTHWYNFVSRAAIARLGAKQDGVIRQHHIEADGSYRDTVVFSILNSEWPSVRKSLAHALDYGRA